MRIRWTCLLLAGAALAAPLAQADNYDPYAPLPAPDQSLAPPTTDIIPQQEPGVATGTTTTAEAEEVTRGLYGSPFTVTPALGALGFADVTNSYTSRMLYGLHMDFAFGDKIGTDRVKVGLTTGFLYSHLGGSGSTFWGNDSGNQGGANSFLVPIEITTGYSLNDRMLVALNFGTNLLYRSIASSMQIGRNDQDTGSSFVALPSLGLTWGWAVSPIVAISLRGDYIPAPADDMFTATLGATFPLA